MINIEEFSKIEIRVGEVREAVNVEKSEKLIRLVVNFGEFERVIFTGVRTYGYSAEDFAGKRFLFVTNLEYRKMMGEESQGMILAVDPPSPTASEGQASSTSSGQVESYKPIFVSAEGLPVGAKVR